MPNLFKPEIHLVDGQAVTTSREIAAYFSREHRNVVQKILNLDIPEGFMSAEFSAHPYKHPQNGESYTEYQITRDGFTFLAMSFTGKKAAAFKVAYIEAFNAMEKQLRAQAISNGIEQLNGYNDTQVMARIDALVKDGQLADLRDQRYAVVERGQLSDLIMRARDNLRRDEELNRLVGQLHSFTNTQQHNSESREILERINEQCRSQKPSNGLRLEALAPRFG